MIYGYIRVSTKGQEDGNSIEQQSLDILKRYPDAELFIETLSGAEERNLFNEVLEKVQENDLLVVTSLDRFCRTTKEGLEAIDYLRNKNVIIHIMNMGIIEDTAVGRMIVTNLLAFAEYERAMITERTQRGKAIARKNKDYKEGRPPKYSRKHKKHALSLLTDHTYREVEEMTGISKSTLIRAKREKLLLDEK